jgi:hypothetical protein
VDAPDQVFNDEQFEADIKKQAAYWQKLLFLQDWVLDIRVSRQWEMEDDTTLAQCSWFLHRKDAIIRVLHPTDLPGLSTKFLHGEENDYDVSLVHELLHLHFAPLTNPKEKYHEIAEEQAINAISRGMVKLYRSNTTPAEPEKVEQSPGHNGYL